MIRATNNTIVIEPNYEVLTRLSDLHFNGGELDTKEFGKVTVGGVHTYNNARMANNIAWGTVQSVGRGAAWMQDRYRLDKVLRPGDVIAFDSRHEVSSPHDGKQIGLIPIDQALCVFNASMDRPKPLGVYMMTVAEPGALARFIYDNPETAARYAMTRDMEKGELKVSDNPHSQVKFTLERVLDVGAGGMAHSEIRTELRRSEEIREEVRVDGATKGVKVLVSRVWEKRAVPVPIHPDPEAIGLLAAFLPTMSVDLNIKGVRHRFTNWDRIRFLWHDEQR